MNNQKSKSVKRKFLDSDDSSEDESSKKNLTSSSSADGASTSRNGVDENASTSTSSSSCDGSESSAKSSSSSKLRVPKKTKTFKFLTSDSSSDSGDENCDKCAICLRSITSQEVGNPEGCDHLFCSVCIIEWSKNSNVCPLDRQQFSIILVRKHKNGNVVRRVTAREDRPHLGRIHFWRMIQNEFVNETVCEICGNGDREDILLLCDLCDRGFHTVCLTPPLENIPDDNEWYCPDCDGLRAYHDDIYDLYPRHRNRTLRPRFTMVRTRLLERIRVTVNRIVENYVLGQSEGAYESSALTDTESDSTEFTSSNESYHPLDTNQPSTSGLQRQRQTRPQTTTTRKVTKTRKSTVKATKASGKGKKTKKTTTKKRKTTTGAKKKKKSLRKKVKTTRTKKVKVENEDGTVTEKVVKTRVYKRMRQKKKKKKTRMTSSGVRRGLRVKSKATPKTAKGRLTLKLRMMPTNKPGQLLPEIKVRPPNSHLESIDLNRARAGIPKLHIFGPRDELQYYSSESDHENFGGSESGGVMTATRPRTNISRIQNRKKAALIFQSRTATSSAPRPKPVIESPANECVDILGSILDSQAIWHSKNTNVKINDDGSIEVLKDTNENVNKAPKPENSKTVDVRETTSEGMTTQAPMYPGSGSRSGGFRPYNRNNYGDSRSGSDNMFAPRSGQSQAGSNFNRFGGPARNDREGYTNYLNNMPQGPAPFCRGGPPLRFRMPPRQQLRRIPFPPRNRPSWQSEEGSDEGSNRGNDRGDKKTEEETKKNKAESRTRDEEEDVDLYSDIETNTDKAESSGAEDAPTTTTTTTYPALGPPPQPSQFLLGLGEALKTQNTGKSEVYDPAEPCDSDDETGADENRQPAQTSEKKVPEQKSKESDLSSAPPKRDTGIDADVVTKSTSPKASSEDDDDEDCPIFSIYSSATREFSQKEEEERQREIAEDRRKLEEMKKQEEQKSIADLELLPKEAGPEENLNSDVTEEEKPITEVSEEISQIEDKKKENDDSKLPLDVDNKNDEKFSTAGGDSKSPESAKDRSHSRSISPRATKEKEERSPSPESDKEMKSPLGRRSREKSSSSDRASEKFKRSIRKSKYDSDSEGDAKKRDRDRNRKSDDDKENDETGGVIRADKDDKTPEKELGSEDEPVASPQKVAAGLEGLDVEEVSSDNGGDDFGDKRSLSSLSLSDFSNKSKRSAGSGLSKKKKKNKKKKTGKSKSDKSFEDEEDRSNRLKESFRGSKNENEEIGNENSLKSGEKRKGRKSKSVGLERQVLGSRENKKSRDKSKEKDLSWKKPSKKDRNYREGKKKSKERGRSKSNDRRRSRSTTPKKDRKKNKDRKKKVDRKKEIERYDVRKIVKNKEVRKTDAFGRDIISKSRSMSRSRTRSPIRERSRNMLRRDSRSYSRSRSRSFRRGRSPVRRRYLRSRTRSRSKSAARRSYSRSRSRSRSRKIKKKPKSKDRLKIRSRSRGRKSRSCSRGQRRRTPTRSRTRSPVQRVMRSKKTKSRRRSWSHHESRTPSFSPRRSRSITRSPIRVRRTYSRSASKSWSRGRSPLPRASSLEKLTVILTTKDKKKWKKKKEGKKTRKEEKRKKKSGGNSKEIFASGDNVLVSVNFRNNNSSNGNDDNSVTNNEGRNSRLNSLSPVPALETPRKKKRERGSDYENEKVTKKSKKSNAISKKVVDVALSNSCSKRAKKLTRLSEKDAEVILNRKPVAVIDLDMSPYREQTPSPVNVVVVSDSGSGDEAKERTPQRQNVRGTPVVEAEKVEENVGGGQSVDASTTNSPVENGYVPPLGPKTPPEPQIKFSINKPQQLRPIANPLGDDDDDEEEEEEEANANEDRRDGAEAEERMESLDLRIEKELNPRSEIPHKGPNTPPTPRGPSTPKSPPSPQSSPDAYDPFEPTKSRSPTPSQDDKENRPSPKSDSKEDETSQSVQGEGVTSVVQNSMVEDSDKTNDVISESQESKNESSEKNEPMPAVECPSSNVVTPTQGPSAAVSENSPTESPERKIGVVISTPQSKSQTPTPQKTFSPVLKQVPMVSSSTTTPSTAVNMVVSTDIFAVSSPSKTRTSTTTATTQTLQVSGIQRLQHRLGSPVNRTPNSVKSTPEKRTTPSRPDSSNEIFSTGNYMIRNVSKRNGEQPKQTRPLQDATNETIDVDMDDSPYSPASSEGDDLFDPPPEVSTKPSQSNAKPTPSHKPLPPKPHLKSPTKQLNKFDLLFGLGGGPTLSPLKVGNKKSTTKLPVKPPSLPKLVSPKPQKKGTSKRSLTKMDEDQLRILDELPSSAVELQVKDKFLKKLNRQERVVDEVKTVLKPHYARKHITKEEYKDILRRSVPKICHSRSGEINPSKIQSLIEAYVRKFRHAKKKGMNAVAKPKVKKTMFS